MMVVVLGLVAFVAVIGVIRFRASRSGAAGNDAANGAMGGDDYHWVDELNIIVNPMEEQVWASIFQLVYIACFCWRIFPSFVYCR